MLVGQRGAAQGPEDNSAPWDLLPVPMQEDVCSLCSEVESNSKLNLKYKLKIV